jgi:hypothetical protein
MEQYFFAASVYGPICVKQPLTAGQVEQFVQQRGETEEIEVFFVMGGYFIAPHFEPGVIFVEDPKCDRGQLFIKLKGTRTFWSMCRTELSLCRESIETILNNSGPLAKQILGCDPITAFDAYRKTALELAVRLDIKNPKFVDVRQTSFIGMKMQYGAGLTSVAAGA